MNALWWIYLPHAAATNVTRLDDQLVAAVTDDGGDGGASSRIREDGPLG